MFSFQPNTRIRPSPFFEAALAEGLKTANVYNRMIMPTSFGDPEGEYWRLINGVSQWDVGVERQVQLKGPDAARLEPGRGRDDVTLAAAAALGLLAPLAGAGGVAVVIGCVFRGVRGPSSWGRSLRAGIWAWGTYGASWPRCSLCGWCRAHGGRGASLCVYVHG